MNSIDLYLGTFLIISGFGISFLNLRRLIKGSRSFSTVLISENLLLMCVGIAFVSRSLQEYGTFNSNMEELEKRTASMELSQNMNCNFLNVLKMYGPFVVSLVNSFLSLIIDNYMHFMMLKDLNKEEEESTVRNLNNLGTFHNLSASVKSVFRFGRKYFSYLAIGLQWIVPILLALLMYPMQIEEKYLSRNFRSDKECMAMIDITNETCVPFNGNISNEFRLFIPNYLEAYETNSNSSAEFDRIVNNINNIVNSFQNMSNVDELWREPKMTNNCMKICYLDNKNLLIYMFGVSILSYFVPITISTAILTKIQTINVQKPHAKTYVSRELLYNVLFWTPAIFDTFLTLMLCSYSMNGMRTSIFNVVANVYQVVKNFMNTKYFKYNSVNPV